MSSQAKRMNKTAERAAWTAAITGEKPAKRGRTGQRAHRSPGEEAFALHLAANGIESRRQYRFCPTRKWAADFAWPHLLLIVEIDGHVHRIKERFAADIERHNWLQMNGWRHLRFSTKMVLSGEAIEMTKIAIGSTEPV